MITFRQSGDFKHTELFFKRAKNLRIEELLNQYGREGVTALVAATPIDTGKTSQSWDYRIKRSNRSLSIEWFNTNIVDGVPIAVIIQYGHGTQRGGYVQGIDYVNPAMKDIFKKFADTIWKEVTET